MKTKNLLLTFCLLLHPISYATKRGKTKRKFRLNSWILHSINTQSKGDNTGDIYTSTKRLSPKSRKRKRNSFKNYKNMKYNKVTL